MILNDLEYKRICNEAIMGMDKLRQMDYNIDNACSYAHWSITYVPKNKHYHWYIEEYGVISFIVNEYGYIEYKKTYNKYNEGKSSVILMCSDYAKGKSSWDLTDYANWSNLKDTNLHALFYYTN